MPKLSTRNLQMPTPRANIVASVLMIALLAIPSVVVAQTGSTTLYDALGGESVVIRVVDELIDTTSSNPRTKRSFDKVNLKNLKKKLFEQICALADGPCKYTGDTMAQSHKGLDITESEFYLLVQQLRDTLDKLGVADSAKNELLKRLAPMKRDVVTH